MLGNLELSLRIVKIALLKCADDAKHVAKAAYCAGVRRVCLMAEPNQRNPLAAWPATNEKMEQSRKISGVQIQPVGIAQMSAH